MRTVDRYNAQAADLSLRSDPQSPQPFGGGVLTPRVSVIMSVYAGNTLEEVADAANSILEQTIESFEFLILGDGTLHAELANYLTDLAASDPRVRLVLRNDNQGIARSLNALIKLAHADYVAIMDSDDRSAPQRLERQMAYLEENASIDIVGTFALEIDSQGNAIFEKRMPVDPAAINRLLCYRDPLVHPSVMYRKSVFDRLGYYDESKMNAFLNDTELWTRAVLAGHKIANVPEVLYYFRRNESFLRRRRGWRLAYGEFRLRAKYIRSAGFPLHRMLLSLAVAIVRLSPPSILRWFYKYCR